MSTVASRWAALQAELAVLAPSRTVRVIAVAKHQPASVIEEALACGIREFGDNYVQQGAELRGKLGTAAAGLKWHFIGHIQSRKARDLVGYDCIQSVDRLEVMEAITKRMKLVTDRGAARKLNILVQVNIGNEPQKSGITPDSLPQFLDGCEALGIASMGIHVDGLMAMPPAVHPVDTRARYFEAMRELFDTYAAARGWQTLSLGTSEDYPVAIRCGATMIRLGTSLLGARPTTEA